MFIKLFIYLLFIDSVRFRYGILDVRNITHNAFILAVLSPLCSEEVARIGLEQTVAREP
jgi:hypothetical protein